MKTAIAFLIYLTMVLGAYSQDPAIKSIYDFQILEKTATVTNEQIVDFNQDDFNIKNGLIRVVIDTSNSIKTRIIVIKESDKEPKLLVFEKYIYPDIKGAKEFNQGNENLNEGNYVMLAFDPETHERYLIIIFDRGFTQLWKFQIIQSNKQFAYITTHAKDVTRQVLSQQKTGSQ